MKIEDREKIKSAYEECARLDRIANDTAEATAARKARESYAELCESLGALEPEIWCEFCMLPFFDNDDYVCGEDGAVCREDGPCLKRPA